jgi:ABC-2 type transport system permease protein
MGALMATLRSLLFLARLTLSRQLRSKKMLLVLFAFACIAALVVIVGMVKPWRPGDLLFGVVLILFCGFFVPISSLAFGTGAVGDDRDEGSLVHLLARPLPRAGIYAAKLLGVAPLVLLMNLGGLWMIGLLARIQGGAPLDILGAFWPGVLLGTLAYLSLFQLLAVAFRHSTAVAIAYTFFIEVFIDRMPGILKRVSIDFYATSIHLETAGPIGLSLPREAERTYLPLDGETARWVLVCIAAGLLLLGMRLFQRKEYRETV